jgi:hypothetical protein
MPSSISKTIDQIWMIMNLTRRRCGFSSDRYEARRRRGEKDSIYR